MSSSVSISIATNTAIAAAKGFGWMVTASPTLFAETVHSLADIANQVLLKVGEVRGRGGVVACAARGHGGCGLRCAGGGQTQAGPRGEKALRESPWLAFCATFAPGADASIMPGPIRVQIFGQTYSIAGDLDAAYVQQLAAYVDEKMRAIADSTSTIDTQRAAVLAALAIADELHTGLRERGEREELLREQAERCLTLVERALKQTA